MHTAPGALFAICSWSSVHFKYGPGAYFDLEYPSRLLMVRDHGSGAYGLGAYGPDHMSRPKSQKKLPTPHQSMLGIRKGI